MLERQNWRVAHNATGANLENGLITALLESTNLIGQPAVDYAILEVDENVLPKVLPAIQPRLILCLNLFRDQLDRYGEVRLASAGDKRSPPTRRTVVVVNADDPTLSHLGQHLPQRSVLWLASSRIQKSPR